MIIYNTGMDLSNQGRTALCLNKPPSQRESRRNPIVVTTLATVIILMSTLMVVKLTKYVMDRSKNGKVPAIFGRYQRNALSLTQVYVQGVVYLILALKNLIVVAMNIELDLARSFLFVSNLIISNILMDFILPIIALGNLYKNVPEFFQENTNATPRRTTFYVRNPTILPRVDAEHGQHWNIGNPIVGASQPLSTTNQASELEQLPMSRNNNPTINVQQPSTSGVSNNPKSRVKNINPHIDLTKPPNSQKTDHIPTIEVTTHYHSVMIHCENEDCNDKKEAKHNVLEMKARKKIQDMTLVV